jgi:PadR family transcriptional regulator, regulatory protein PadR
MVRGVARTGEGGKMELIQGTLDVLILRTLAWGPTHGYGVSEWIRDRTGGTLAVQDAALYQALRRLERRGWVEAEWGLSENNRRARFYTLTAAGRAHLQEEAAAWRRYVDAVFQVLEPLPGEG